MTAPAAIRFRDVAAAELTKTRTLPATWIALAIAAVADILLGVLASTSAVRTAPSGLAGTLTMASVYAFAAIAVYAAGSEYRTGQYGLTAAAVPRRHRLYVAKLTGVVLVAAGAVLLPGRLHDDPGGVVASFTVQVLVSLIGYGFAVLTRTVVTPLAALIALPVLVSPALHGLLPEVVRLLPHEAALSVLGRPADPATALDHDGGLLTLLTWAVLSVGTAWATFARRDGA
jgi:ABC-2 type transport system permease protein